MMTLEFATTLLLTFELQTQLLTSAILASKRFGLLMFQEKLFVQFAHPVFQVTSAEQGSL